MASRQQPVGEESSSSDSSEESSSEEEQQLLQHSDKQEQSSSSGSEDESGSGTGQDGEVRGHEADLVSEDDDNSGNHATNRMASTNSQDLFGGESSSGSSSGSGSEGGPDSVENFGSPSGSRTSEPPSTSPLEEMPPEEEPRDRKGRNSQTLEGIFGDAADLSSSDDEGEADVSVQRRVHEEVDFGDMSDDGGGEGVEARTEEGAEEEEVEEAPRINVDIPRCVAELGSDIHFVKLPNFLSVEPRFGPVPFDPNLYEDEGEDEDILDEEGRARLKLKVENTIRWRYTQDEEGNEVRESNTRVVRWTDGTLSLFLGSEIFDISKQPLQGEYSHLFVRQGTGLQGQAVFKNKITFRPHSTDSQTHRKMTLSIADRFSKAQKIRVLPVAGKDPESQRSERIKKAEEILRAAVRSDNQKRRMKERSIRKGGITASYLEPDRELDLEDIGAMKSSFRSRVSAKRRGHEDTDESSEEEEEEEEEEEAHERLMRAKDNRGESPPSKRQTRGNTIRGDGDKDKGHRGVRNRKLLSSSEEEESD